GWGRGGHQRVRSSYERRLDGGHRGAKASALPAPKAGTLTGTASILTIGNELVSGDVPNTNASWLARRLAPLGVAVRLTAALPDGDRTAAQYDPAAAARGAV